MVNKSTSGSSENYRAAWDRIAWRNDVGHSPWRSQNKEAVKVALKGISPINKSLGSKIVYGWLDEFSHGLPKFPINKPILAGSIFAGLALTYGVGHNLSKTIKD